MMHINEERSKRGMISSDAPTQVRCEHSDDSQAARPAYICEDGALKG
jgi:hypothetical protein